MARILLIIAFAFISADCLAQLEIRNGNPMQYALIDGTDQSQPSVPRSYLQYVNEIVMTYKIQFHLSETQEYILSSGLINYYLSSPLYSPKGVKVDDIHKYIGERLKAILPFSQYLQWKSQKSYPEYSFSIG